MKRSVKTNNKEEVLNVKNNIGENLSQLPDDLLFLIVSFLKDDLRSVGQLSKSSKFFKQLLSPSIILKRIIETLGIECLNFNFFGTTLLRDLNKIQLLLFCFNHYKAFKDSLNAKQTERKGTKSRNIIQLDNIKLIISIAEELMNIPSEENLALNSLGRALGLQEEFVKNLKLLTPENDLKNKIKLNPVILKILENLYQEYIDICVDLNESIPNTLVYKLWSIILLRIRQQDNQAYFTLLKELTNVDENDKDKWLVEMYPLIVKALQLPELNTNPQSSEAKRANIVYRVLLQNGFIFPDSDLVAADFGDKFTQYVSRNYARKRHIPEYNKKNIALFNEIVNSNGLEEFYKLDLEKFSSIFDKNLKVLKENLKNFEYANKIAGILNGNNVILSNDFFNKYPTVLELIQGINKPFANLNINIPSVTASLFTYNREKILLSIKFPNLAEGVFQSLPFNFSGFFLQSIPMFYFKDWNYTEFSQLIDFDKKNIINMNDFVAVIKLWKKEEILKFCKYFSENVKKNKGKTKKEELRNILKNGNTGLIYLVKSIDELELMSNIEIKGQKLSDILLFVYKNLNFYYLSKISALSDSETISQFLKENEQLWFPFIGKTSSDMELRMINMMAIANIYEKEYQNDKNIWNFLKDCKWLAIMFPYLQIREIKYIQLKELESKNILNILNKEQILKYIIINLFSYETLVANAALWTKLLTISDEELAKNLFGKNLDDLKKQYGIVQTSANVNSNSNKRSLKEEPKEGNSKKLKADKLEEEFSIDDMEWVADEEANDQEENNSQSDMSP